MIEHNSEVYNHPYISFFIVHSVYMEEDLCRGGCILHCYVRSSLLFPYFLPFWYPYILLHFKCFLLLVLHIFPHNTCTWYMHNEKKYVGCCILNCIMPSSLLVFILFAVLLSLHLHTYTVFYTCLPHFCSSMLDSIYSTYSTQF